MGYDEGPTPEVLEDYLFPPTLLDRPGDLLLFYAIRDQDRLSGLALEHDWDYARDTHRELDMVLVGFARPSPKVVLDIMSSLMDSCYQRGARQTFANMREGAGGKGFPRLFARLGGTDITEQIQSCDAGQKGRRYYAATPKAFYASAIGQRFTAAKV